MNIKKAYFIIALLTVMCLPAGCAHKTAGSVAAAGSGTWLNHDRRSAGTIVDDQAITIKANLAIAKDRELWRQSHINTLSYNGNLLLVGQTSSEALKHRVEKILTDIPEIDKIYNELTVTSASNFHTRMQDTWITTQVKAKILSTRQIGPNRVKVITEDGKVYLMGLLTKDEAETVADIVSQIKGVEEVKTIFENIG